MRYLAPSLLVFALACSDDEPQIPEPTDETEPPVDTSPPVDTDNTPVERPELSEDCLSPSALGLENWCDFSVNEAVTTLVGIDTLGLSLLTPQSGPVPADQQNYNGPGRGRGHRAFAGYHGYDATPVSNLSTIAFTGYSTSGVLPPEIILQVDLACDSTNVIQVLTDTTQATVTPVEGVPDSVFSYLITSPVWFSSPSSLPVPDTDDTDAQDSDAQDTAVEDGYIFPSKGLSGEGDPGSLEELLSYYPNACLRNGDFALSGLPASTAVSGFMISVGSPSNTNGHEWIINKIVVGTDEHLPLELSE